MTASQPSDERDILVGAYIDGELDALAARAFEERLAREPELAAELRALQALRDGIRAARNDDQPSADLTRRVAAIARPRWPPARAWMGIAAALLVGIVVGSAATVGTLRVAPQPAVPSVAAEVIDAHLRALMAPQPIDVASSDQHTVKPWFAGKIAFAPTVIDLAAQGFPLVGGRIDVLGLQPAPALVYRAAKHLISVVEMPAVGSAPLPLTTSVSRGYEVLAWSDGKVAFWAVSDASDDELKTFVAALQMADAPALAK